MPSPFNISITRRDLRFGAFVIAVELFLLALLYGSDVAALAAFKSNVDGVIIVMAVLAQIMLRLRRFTRF